MPCFCKNKVDRLQVKVLCILCKQYMHAKCYNIKKEEIDLIKETFKFKSCAHNRRFSLTKTPVLVTMPVNESDNNTEDVVIAKLNSADKNSSLSFSVNEEVESVGAGESNLGFGAKVDEKANGMTLNMLFTELCALKQNNEDLKNLVSKLAKVNNTLLNKVDNLELLFRTKHCLCHSSNDNNVLKKSSSFSNVRSANNNHVTNVVFDRALSKPFSSSLPTVDLTNTTNDSESLNSYASIAKRNITNDAVFIKSNIIVAGKKLSTLTSAAAGPNVAHNNSWNVVGRNKRYKNSLVGTCSSNDLGVINNFKWLHVSSFKNSVNEHDIISYLSKNTNISTNHIACFKLVKKDENICNRKIY